MKRYAILALALSVIGCADTTDTQVVTGDIEIQTSVDEIPATEIISQDDIDAAALALLKYHDGIWDSRWEWFDPDGKVLGESTGTEAYTLVGDGYSQTMVNKVPQFNQISHGLLAYNPVKRKILFLSVGAKGDYWVMHQDPVTGTIVSDPHVDAEGNEMLIRFTTLEKSKNAMKIQMESSTDAGETWTTGFHQYATRRLESAKP